MKKHTQNRFMSGHCVLLPRTIAKTGFERPRSLRQVIAAAAVWAVVVGLSGSCATVIEDELCTPDQKVCIDGNPFQCSSSGDEFVALNTCQVGESCIAGGCVGVVDVGDGDTGADGGTDTGGTADTTPDNETTGADIADVMDDIEPDITEPDVEPSDINNDQTGDIHNDDVQIEDGGADSGVRCVPESCDDGNPCTDDDCDPVDGCTYTQISGTTCDDGDPCTADDGCNNGVCESDKLVNCEDNNPCTQESCVPQVGCEYSPTTAPCDDGESCTESDTCLEGNCVGVLLIDCNDGNPCTKDLCDLEAGCSYETLAGAICDGPGSCLENGTCVDTQCTGGTPVDCNDDNPCTDDVCVEDMGCTYTPVLDIVCDDGDPCSIDDTCQNGTCTAGSAKLCNDNDECTDDGCDSGSGCVFTKTTGSACNDDDLCTTGDSCSDGICTGGELVNCNDENPCTTDSCQNGNCIYILIENDAVCDDENACTSATQCTDGQCVGGEQTDCSDGNPCTTDPCDPQNGCDTSIPNDGTACDDDNVCTTAEICDNGVCEPLTTLLCDDNNPCTIDTCDPQLSCKYDAAPAMTQCVDGDPCFGPDTCDLGVCKAGPKVICNDNEACTADSCTQAKGCVFTPILVACNDDNACTVGDSCKAGKCVPGTTVVECDDGLSCTTDYCDAKTGKCAFDPQPMNGKTCTAPGTATAVCDTGVCVSLPYALPVGPVWSPVGSPKGLPFGMPWPPDTGQQKCYSAAQPDTTAICSPIAEQCASTPGCGQDGQYNYEDGWYSPNRMQKLTLADVAMQVWADNLTGLLWSPISITKGSYVTAGETCANYGAPIDSQPWRMPDWQEVWTLTHFGKHNPASVHPTAVSGQISDLLWTATAAFEGSRWTLDVYDGRLVAISDETAQLGVVCVNGTQQTQSVPHRFFEAKLGNETVIFDPWTNLVWIQQPASPLSWTMALSYCEGLQYAGLNNWRLPSITELVSLQNNAYDGAIDTTVFPNAANKQYWTSTTADPTPSHAWVAYQYYGGTGHIPKTDAAYTRCVVANPKF